jgi:hypothetical protein
MISLMRINACRTRRSGKVPRIPEIVDRPSDRERRSLDYTIQVTDSERRGVKREVDETKVEKKGVQP